MSTSDQLSADVKPSIGGIIKNGAIAGGIGLVINALLFFVSSAMGAFPETLISPMGTPITIVAVIVATVIGAVFGTIGYLVLSRFLTKERANRWFIILAVIVLIFQVIPPIFQLPGASALTIITLEVMHLVIGGALIYFLPRSV